MWPLLFALVAFAAAGSNKKTSPKVVKLKAGRNYRMRVEIVRSTVPLSAEFLEALKQSFVVNNGATDVVIKPTAKPPYIEYTIVQRVDGEITTGAEITLKASEEIQITMVWRWVKEVTGGAGV